MKKKLYTQPTTDFAFLANGRPIMDRITLSGSGSAGQMAPTRNGASPASKVNIMYI